MKPQLAPYEDISCVYLFKLEPSLLPRADWRFLTEFHNFPIETYRKHIGFSEDGSIQLWDIDKSQFTSTIQQVIAWEEGKLECHRAVYAKSIFHARYNFGWKGIPVRNEEGVTEYRLPSKTEFNEIPFIKVREIATSHCDKIHIWCEPVRPVLVIYSQGSFSLVKCDCGQSVYVECDAWYIYVCIKCHKQNYGHRALCISYPNDYFEIFSLHKHKKRKIDENTTPSQRAKEAFRYHCFIYRNFTHVSISSHHSGIFYMIISCLTHFITFDNPWMDIFLSSNGRISIMDYLIILSLVEDWNSTNIKCGLSPVWCGQGLPFQIFLFNFLREFENLINKRRKTIFE
jgi:hypothetical protein